MLTPLSAFEGAAFAAGCVQAVLALVFWRGHALRPDWGLSWLSAGYAASAVINMPGVFGAGGYIADSPQLLVVNWTLGFLALGGLWLGVHGFVGRLPRRPWRGLVAFIVAFVGAATLPRLMGLSAVLAGHLVSAGVFLYLALLCARALPRLAGVAFPVATMALVAYPVMLLAAIALGLADAALRLWSAVPNAIVGLGLLVAALGRYHLELSEELARRQRAEADLRQLNASLELRVAERTEELNDMVSGLESFNRMVSHDLRGPLGGLEGLSRLIERALTEGDTARALRLVRLMGGETHKLVDLVNDLLILARINHGEMDLRPTPLDEVLDEALQTLALSRGAEKLAAVARDPLPVARADGRLLRHVFVNLVGNALKFSAGRENVEVRVRGDRAAQEVVVEVRDNGVGFPTDHAHELFQPFKRLHGAKFEGSGIGLTIVRRIVERHGGRVWAESHPGQGASFFFSLPA